MINNCESLSKLDFTPLEMGVLNLYYDAYSNKNFPQVDRMILQKRRVTDAGRQLFLTHPDLIDLEDQKLFSGRYCYIEVASLRAGLSYWINIIEKKIESLVINVNGNYHWDNDECGWSIADPETGICNILQS